MPPSFYWMVFGVHFWILRGNDSHHAISHRVMQRLILSIYIKASSVMDSVSLSSVARCRAFESSIYQRRIMGALNRMMAKR